MALEPWVPYPQKKKKNTLFPSPSFSPLPCSPNLNPNPGPFRRASPSPSPSSPSFPTLSSPPPPLKAPHPAPCHAPCARAPFSYAHVLAALLGARSVCTPGTLSTKAFIRTVSVLYWYEKLPVARLVVILDTALVAAGPAAIQLRTNFCREYRFYVFFSTKYYHYFNKFRKIKSKKGKNKSITKRFVSSKKRISLISRAKIFFKNGKSGIFSQLS
ncbi:hypothetical protein, conserved in T. vivax [Trypanosoma vivax Y486]|uniref:Uncharacterized protein n=1 Tax=Trypanosoma vivax (strain Y486) TaxID=1055687 RepID=F9WKG8_TRYVY|nr:hypothetical protein, conserved in T. vivax [Trypanosoma vivax Y486]|eukprot:CCD17988.1 hypothetical protein, conserved in T. vivax [Trypanosoma vivax Y486]